MGAGDLDFLISLHEGPSFLFFDLHDPSLRSLVRLSPATQRGRAATHADGDQVLVDT